MKQLYGKLWVKCTAIALLVVFAILFAASALGTAYLFTYGAYADGGEQVRQIAENEILQQTNGDGWTALHAWADDDKITRDLLRERYDPLTSNIYFKLTDKDTGKILFSTGALNKDDYTGKASAYYQQDMTTSLDDGSEVTAVYQAYLKSPLAPNDRALYIMTWVNRLIDARYLLPVLAVLLLAVCLFLFIFLLCAMGHKEGVDGIYQCWLNKIPLDLFLALLVLLFFRYHIRAIHHHDAVIYPFAVISPELRQPVHAEPQQSIKCKFKCLLSFKFCKKAVPACHFLECFQFIHRQKTHIRTSCKPCSIHCPCSKPGFNFFQINAYKVAPAKQTLHKTFKL